MSGGKRSLRLGTRGSQLALRQAEWIKSRIEAAHPGLEVRLVTIKTKGDKILDVPLAKVGGKGLFVKEIEAALLAGEVDLAVHSLKDLPAEMPAGLHLAAIPPRGDPRDVLIGRECSQLGELPPAARVGTSSLRRQAQLRHRRADLTVVNLRGNVDTRLRRLASGEVDAVVLAAAGLNRLGIAVGKCSWLDFEVMLPAAGQGALAVECRRDDRHTNALVRVLSHADTEVAVAAERAFLRRLGGGCQVPIGAYATVEEGMVVLEGMVATIDGSRVIRRRRQDRISRAAALGERVASEILAAGGTEILALVYGSGAAD